LEHWHVPIFDGGHEDGEGKTTLKEIDPQRHDPVVGGFCTDIIDLNIGRLHA
jgi:hypothetical protein